MEIFGFIVLSLVMTCVTLLLAIIGLLAGYEFSPLPFKAYWWYLPLVGLAFWFWKMLLAASPFTVIVN